MRVSRLVLAVVAAVALIGIIALVYVYASGGSGKASQPITAPTLDVAAQPTSQATEDPAAATEDAPGPAADSGSGDPVVFSLVPGDSTVRFELDEDLRGTRNTVAGTTPDVAGQIRIDFANPSASEVGVIRFNLRTLATDNDFRNRAIRGQILQSAQDAFEFGEFRPAAITGLPARPIEPGHTVSFQITGDLVLRDIAVPVTFDVVVSDVSETRLAGEATATVNRTDWGLTIPDVPGVANVEEEVTLTIVFVAEPGE